MIPVSSFVLDKVRVFTLWKLANATNQSPQKANCYLPAHQWTQGNREWDILKAKIDAVWRLVIIWVLCRVCRKSMY